MIVSVGEWALASTPAADCRPPGKAAGVATPFHVAVKLLAAATAGAPASPSLVLDIQSRDGPAAGWGPGTSRRNHREPASSIRSLPEVLSLRRVAQRPACG